MVRITVNNINFGEKEVELKEGTVSELIADLGMNDDSVIIVGDDGDIYTKDRKMENGKHFSVIEVFSGG